MPGQNFPYTPLKLLNIDQIHLQKSSRRFRNRMQGKCYSITHLVDVWGITDVASEKNKEIKALCAKYSMHRCVVDIKYAVEASKPQGSQLFGLAALSHPEKGSLVILQRPVQASLNQSLGRKWYLNHASQLQSAGASKPHYQFWNQIFESILRDRLEVVNHSMPSKFG